MPNFTLEVFLAVHKINQLA